MNDIPCAEVVRRLDDYIDRELANAEMLQVRAHLIRCEACATEHQFEETIVAELRCKIRKVSIPEDFKRRLLATLNPSP